MTKLLIVDSQEHTKVPFLRGILTHSLRDAGLSFEQAYSVASQVREELSEKSVVTTEELKGAVITHLERNYGKEAVERYGATRSPDAILVYGPNGHTTAFSRSRHRQCLLSCGLSMEEAGLLTAEIYNDLTKKRISKISTRELGYLTYRTLHRESGAETARRYLVWVDHLHSDRPLLVLIGGAPGCGKSTIATELAHRLGIVRTQSTDMLREVMRMMLPRRLLPVLHASSFNAWEMLPSQDCGSISQDYLIADGYRAQAWLLSVACEAVISRALKERVSLILEGVHVQPTLLERIARDKDAVLVPVMLAVLKQEDLRSRFRGRGKELAKRRAERYLQHFHAIWNLQSWLVSEADRCGVQIVSNEERERAVVQVMTTITDTMSTNFTRTPEQVFA